MKYQQYSPRDLFSSKLLVFKFSIIKSSQSTFKVGYLSISPRGFRLNSPGVSYVGWSFLLWLWRHWQLEGEADPQTAASTLGRTREDVLVMMIGYFRNILVAFKGLFQDFQGMG